ncbi:4-hydroxy-tetrahydrodipicolinate reductase [soil metagenome]
MNIALIGYGSMGRMVEAKARERGHSIVTIINEHHSSLDAEHLGESLRAADVAIDFSAAYAVSRNVSACMAAGLPLVQGTTGWNNGLDEIRSIVAANNGAMVYGANFSVGVNLFYRIVENAARLLAKFPEYEAFIEEQHHSRKKDSPSGTALKLKDIVATHINVEFGVTSTRAGHIPGTHTVGFDGPADQIRLEHSARSRDGFALGSLIAAEWIVGKTGVYEFGQVVNEIIGVKGERDG